MLTQTIQYIGKWFVLNKWRNFYFLLLVLLFSISVYVRAPHIGQSFNVRHDWLSAHTLVTCKIWNTDGIAYHKFTSVYTFGNRGDKFDYSMCALVDQKGDGYYVSYGPFALILPYVVFKIFGIPFNEIAIDVFGLGIHFLTAYFIFLTVLILARKKTNEFSLAATIAYVLYVFSPGTLWFHANVYFSEILAQLILAIGLYMISCIFEQKGNVSKKTVWIFGIICFLGTYTEWLGLFFGFFAGITFLVIGLWQRQYLKFFYVAGIACILSLVLIIFQYSSIAGFEMLKKVSLNKLNERSTTLYTQDLGNGLTALEQVGEFIQLNFSTVLNFLRYALILALPLCVFKKSLFFTKSQVFVLTILLCTVLLHHMVFFNFTYVHDFSVLKTGLLMVVCIGFLLSRVEAYADKVLYGKWILMVVLVPLTYLESKEAVKQYAEYNEFKEGHEAFKNVGTLIHKIAKPHEDVFSNMFVCPQLVFYASRNIHGDDANGLKANEYNRLYKVPTIFFKVEDDHCVSYTRYSQRGDSVCVKLDEIEP